MSTTDVTTPARNQVVRRPFVVRTPDDHPRVIPTGAVIDVTIRSVHPDPDAAVWTVHVDGVDHRASARTVFRALAADPAGLPVGWEFNAGDRITLPPAVYPGVVWEVGTIGGYGYRLEAVIVPNLDVVGTGGTVDIGDVRACPHIEAAAAFTPYSG